MLIFENKMIEDKPEIYKNRNLDSVTHFMNRFFFFFTKHLANIFYSVFCIALNDLLILKFENVTVMN